MCMYSTEFYCFFQLHNGHTMSFSCCTANAKVHPASHSKGPSAESQPGGQFLAQLVMWIGGAPMVQEQLWA